MNDADAYVRRDHAATGERADASAAKLVSVTDQVAALGRNLLPIDADRLESHSCSTVPAAFDSRRVNAS
jgi:hypothetical protein